MSAFRVTKTATGLTGLPVSKTPQHTLSVLYGKILNVLDSMPKDAAYRKYTEEIVKSRAAIVSQAKTSEEIEQKIECGQVEELIIQADNELALARQFARCKPWEPLMTSAPKDQWVWPHTK
ncbi:NADH dehydrogenase [ubiquinone] 1 alpha subcomplex subunit 5-like [Cimex lectularius]|uniref:NADH dehydrogenase [ubiquinone] 1 alpha subcomplex subunit 5 n=1 Tax=Cimex lectularius TaxID=79782 RepID=A0A8I6RLS7_CIMLE|nr:NADH dehydrogenase [ubiquinone] 1 alpha subcomplex subunit 5-like [Cimex lectularius]